MDAAAGARAGGDTVKTEPAIGRCDDVGEEHSLIVISVHSDALRSSAR